MLARDRSVPTAPRHAPAPTRCLLATGAVVVALAASCHAEPRVTLAPADVTGLSDDFDGAALDPSWQAFKAATFAASVSDGALHVVPNRNVVWWRKASGPELFKRVRGNFRVTANVRARSAKDPAQPVRSGYQFGGLIARNPAAAATGIENYVFNVVGYRGTYFSVETKSTRDGVSDVQGPTWANADAELRICRVNDTFTLFRRVAGSPTWERSVSFRRPDLPDELEVGPIAYTYTARWDLRASFDQVRFASVTAAADCAKD